MSVRVEAGSPWVLLACRNVSTTTLPVTGVQALAASR
jgi:ABC-type phosphate transport system auxiliary subunit